MNRTGTESNQAQQIPVSRLVSAGAAGRERGAEVSSYTRIGVGGHRPSLLVVRANEVRVRVLG